MAAYTLVSWVENTHLHGIKDFWAAEKNWIKAVWAVIILGKELTARHSGNQSWPNYLWILSSGLLGEALWFNSLQSFPNVICHKVIKTS